MVRRDPPASPDPPGPVGGHEGEAVVTGNGMNMDSASLRRGDVGGEALKAVFLAHWLATRQDEVRVLEVFVERMKHELAANASKGDRPGWMRMEPRELLAEIQHHYVKLHAAAVEFDREAHGYAPRPVPWGSNMATIDLVAEVAADVANMAMMLADRLGCFDSVSSESSNPEVEGP